ncbi:hypothetical protein E2C01_072823 [Portunus trituberculatus]|uniref:Uncharacterized protein n=1 Tax=Portunus trituberculatus TaxID=210409 RepID=A0A5B7I8X4_PORTR|nr:hypothetical protein [Portunus trituberculatus]
MVRKQTNLREKSANISGLQSDAFPTHTPTNQRPQEGAWEGLIHYPSQWVRGLWKSSISESGGLYVNQ